MRPVPAGDGVAILLLIYSWISKPKRATLVTTGLRSPKQGIAFEAPDRHIGDGGSHRHLAVAEGAQCKIVLLLIKRRKNCLRLLVSVTSIYLRFRPSQRA